MKNCIILLFCLLTHTAAYPAIAPNPRISIGKPVYSNRDTGNVGNLVDDDFSSDYPTRTTGPF